MKRDMDLVRDLLLQIENGSASQSPAATAIDREIRKYHIRIMQDGGLLEHPPAPPVNGLAAFHSPRLTWKGHDFLDSVRDPAIWAKTKDGAAKAGGFTLDLMGALAKGFLKQKIKQHTGLEIEV